MVRRARAILVMLCVTCAVEAQEGIHVSRVELTQASGHLHVGVQCASVFSRKSLSTLQSGLSAVLRLEMRLERSGQARTLMSGDFDVVHETTTARSIAYDVWDERYTVSGPGQVETFQDLEAARQAVSNFEHPDMATIADLKPGVYRVRTRVQLLPVSPEQGERVAAWLQGPGDPGEQTSPTGRRGAEFDVGGLLSMLWGRGPSERDRSAWATSEPLRVDTETAIDP